MNYAMLEQANTWLLKLRTAEQQFNDLQSYRVIGIRVISENCISQEGWRIERGGSTGNLGLDFDKELEGELTRALMSLLEKRIETAKLALRDLGVKE